jgi:hypothetical protein
MPCGVANRVGANGAVEPHKAHVRAAFRKGDVSHTLDEEFARLSVGAGEALEGADGLDASPVLPKTNPVRVTSSLRESCHGASAEYGPTLSPSRIRY